MELPSSLIPVIFTFFLFLFMALRIRRRSKTNNLISDLPPGPWKLPFIGNLHQLFGKMPHRTLRDLAKKYGPLMHLQLGQVHTVVVSSPEIAREVMKTHDTVFSSRPSTLAAKITSFDCTGIAFSPYGNYWRKLRKICTLELLSAKRVQSLRPIREEEVMNLIKWLKTKAGSSINLTKELDFLSYGITSRAAFGMKSKDQEKFISIVHANIKLGAGFNLADLFPSIKLLELISGLRAKLEGLHQEADKILEDIIEEHKKKGKYRVKTGNEEVEDLVDVLLKEQEHSDCECPLTINNIKAIIGDIFAAGSETSAKTVEWAMAEMMKNPEVMERAQTEVRRVFSEIGNVKEEDIPRLHYLKSVLKETLRLHPPAPLLLPRECGEKCEINGYEIPVKTRVIVNAWAIGRDPRYWKDAEKFYPERFLDSCIDYKGSYFEYIPFGAGRRICPGMLFGLASAEHQLAMLLYHFDWKLSDGMKHEDLDMAEVFGVTIGRKEDLILVPIPYNHSGGVSLKT